MPTVTVRAVGDSCTVDYSTAPQFVLGTTKPDASNTGVAQLGKSSRSRAGYTVLTGTGGVLTIDNAFVAAHGAPVTDAETGFTGSRISSMWFDCFVYFTASTATQLYGCVLPGGSGFPAGAPPAVAGVPAAAVVTTNGSGLLSMSYCTSRIAQPDVALSNVQGAWNGKFYRCDFSLGSDGIDFWTTTRGPWVKGCYFHEFTFWASDPKHLSDRIHPGWCHPDFVQHTGAAWSAPDGIIGNTFEVYCSRTYGDYPTLLAWNPRGCFGTAVILTNTSKQHTGVVIQSNWISGGERGVQFAAQGKGFDTGNSWDVSGNRFLPDQAGFIWGVPSPQRYSHIQVACDTGVGMAASSIHDNTYVDGSAVAATATVGGNQYQAHSVDVTR